MGKVAEYVKRNKVPLGLAAAGVGLWGLGASLEPKLVEEFGQNAYNWRHVYGAALGLSGAEAMNNYLQNKLGRPLTTREKATAYFTGIVAGTGVPEMWEYIGSQIPAVQQGLETARNIAGTDIIGKKQFHGMGSAGDMVVSGLGAGIVEGIKEYASTLKRRFSRYSK